MSASPLNITELDSALKDTANQLREAQRTSNRSFNVARRSVSQIQTRLMHTPRILTGTNNLVAASSSNPRDTKVHSRTPRPSATSKVKQKNVAPSKVKQKVSIRRKTPPRDSRQSLTRNDSSESEDDSIFYASSGLTPPSAKDRRALEKTYKEMDSVSPGLGDDSEQSISRSKTPANTPQAASNMVLVRSNIYDGHSSSSSGSAQPATSKKKPTPSKKKPLCTKNCPSCGKKIAVACRKCPHCGASALKQDARSKLLRKRRQEQSAKESKKRTKKTTVTDEAHV